MAFTRNITSSGPMLSRIDGILLFVCALTHELMVATAEGLVKSRALTCASKYCLLSSRNEALNGNVSLYQIELAMVKFVFGSSPLRSEIRDWYPPLTSSRVAPVRRRALLISS